MSIILREALSEFPKCNRIVGQKPNVTGNGVGIGNKPSVPVLVTRKIQAQSRLPEAVLRSPYTTLHRPRELESPVDSFRNNNSTEP